MLNNQFASDKELFVSFTESFLMNDILVNSIYPQILAYNLFVFFLLLNLKYSDGLVSKTGQDGKMLQ